ncbi:hypothetical protein GSI_05076 [Ganoderma sinense ZZ0214-1]|uniref:Uncharacterized protein n=1 Tax=Ganoderma sinense ZZ0214-1 TaxID=1077348 RepID=A0A2G8SHB0_9APHY|nr:hypothetical protein GSI_05076 [Ganoderma sinense ZZ0214-1]
MGTPPPSNAENTNRRKETTQKKAKAAAGCRQGARGNLAPVITGPPPTPPRKKAKGKHGRDEDENDEESEEPKKKKTSRRQGCKAGSSSRGSSSHTPSAKVASPSQPVSPDVFENALAAFKRVQSSGVDSDDLDLGEDGSGKPPKNIVKLIFEESLEEEEGKDEEGAVDEDEDEDADENDAEGEGGDGNEGRSCLVEIYETKRCTPEPIAYVATLWQGDTSNRSGHRFRTAVHTILSVDFDAWKHHNGSVNVDIDSDADDDIDIFGSQWGDPETPVIHDPFNLDDDDGGNIRQRILNARKAELTRYQGDRTKAKQRAKAKQRSPSELPSPSSRSLSVELSEGPPPSDLAENGDRNGDADMVEG